jgi:hypothetical protein
MEIDLIVEYKGFDPGMDAKIRKAAKRSSSGSGFFIPRQIRDLRFTFIKEIAAQEAAKRVGKIKGVKVELCKF